MAAHVAVVAVIASWIGALLSAPIGSGSQAGEREHAALERHRPLLRYDGDEEFFAQPVSLPPGSAEVRSGDRVYGHIASERGDMWLQYWLFYAYNPQDRSPLKTGRHEGDWELIQLRLGENGRPTDVVLSQHSWAEQCAWSELDREPSGAPVLYVANGSHASYSRAGAYDRPFPDPTDEADGDGRHVRPPVIKITDQRPAWVRFPGRWGDTDASFIPGEMSSPVGPRFQESAAWHRPSSYAESVARPCGSGAPSRPWQTALTVGVGLVLMLAAGALIGRRLVGKT